MTTCYMCDKPASSVDHVPPKCIFPERKDTADGSDYRKNLITVPSCEQHNAARSCDDEYFLYVLSASITSNNVGLDQFLTKVRRAFERNPKLVDSLPTNSTPAFNYVTSSGLLDEAYPVLAQGNRIDRVIDCCARGLYFYETNRKFKGTVKSIASFMSYLDNSVNQNVADALFYARESLKSTPEQGANPDVFYYRFIETERITVFLMCFYRGTEFLVRMDKAV